MRDRNRITEYTVFHGADRMSIDAKCEESRGHSRRSRAAQFDQSGFTRGITKPRIAAFRAEIR